MLVILPRYFEAIRMKAKSDFERVLAKSESRDAVICEFYLYDV